MLPDVDFHRLRKPLAEDGAGIHGRVDLLAISHHCVSRQWIIMLEASQLANAAYLAVDRA